MKNMKKWYYKKFENKKMIVNHILAIVFIGMVISIIFPTSGFHFNKIGFVLLGFPILSWFVLPLSFSLNMGIPNNILFELLICLYWPILIFLIVKMVKKKEKIFFIIFSIIYLFSCFGAGRIMTEWSRY